MDLSGTRMRFAWVMLNLNGIFFITSYIPLILLILLIGLELGVAIIQAYVINSIASSFLLLGISFLLNFSFLFVKD